MKMEASVYAVEKIIGYTFHNKKLLEQALTHTSYPEAVSYERLEFVGDAIRATNVSTEKLARAAIRHGLHLYVRHNTLFIVDMINEFVDAVESEDDCVVVNYGGSVKAPKILGDIVESTATTNFAEYRFKFILRNICMGDCPE
ncbi:unnamed protein product [Lathyrus oleraceus]